jgi:hypothetical protein
MLNQKRFGRIFAVVAGASMLTLVGPAAVADDGSVVKLSPVVNAGHGQGNNGAENGPSADNAGNGPNADNCVVVVQPERTLKNGKVIPAKIRVSDACKQERIEERAQIREERAVQREERAQLREEIRAAGGSWGMVVRQETLIKVATKLAERHAQAPSSAALGQILTLINYGLPEQFQFNIEALLARYNLVFADLIKSGGDDDESPEPSPSPSV